MPALNPTTDTAKPYPNHPQRSTGRRIAQNVGGRQIQVVTDDGGSNPKQPKTVTRMLKHSK